MNFRLKLFLRLFDRLNDRSIIDDIPNLSNAVTLKVGSNWIIFVNGAPRFLPTKIRFDRGCTGNIVIFEGNNQFPDEIHFQGNNCRMIWGRDIAWRSNVSVRFSSNDQILCWGAKSTSNGTTIILEGDGRSVIVGEDCMFAKDTTIMTSDLHSIFDTESSEWLNPPKDVVIGDHVWVGQDTMVLKGADIGNCSIIGAKSLVAKSIEPFSLAVGTPAKVIKSGVSWDRERAF